MKEAPPRFVLDASVAVKIFLPESLSEKAQAIFDRFIRDSACEIFVPDLLFVECANVFWKWIVRYRYPETLAGEHLQDLNSLGFTVLPMQALSVEALETAAKTGITAYDACYVVAANRLKIPLITADEKLVTRLGQPNVRWLGEDSLLSE